MYNTRCVHSFDQNIYFINQTIDDDYKFPRYYVLIFRHFVRTVSIHVENTLSLSWDLQHTLENKIHFHTDNIKRLRCVIEHILRLDVRTIVL